MHPTIITFDMDGVLANTNSGYTLPKEEYYNSTHYRQARAIPQTIAIVKQLQKIPATRTHIVSARCFGNANEITYEWLLSYGLYFPLSRIHCNIPTPEKGDYVRNLGARWHFDDRWEVVNSMPETCPKEFADAIAQSWTLGAEVMQYYLREWLGPPQRRFEFAYDILPPIDTSIRRVCRGGKD